MFPTFPENQHIWHDKNPNLEWVQTPKSDPNLHQTLVKCGVTYSKRGGLGTSLTQTSNWILDLIQSGKTTGFFPFYLNHLIHFLSEVQITQAGNLSTE